MCWICTLRGVSPAETHVNEQASAKVAREAHSAQVRAVVRRLQGLVMHGAFTATGQDGNHTTELGTVIRACGCHIVAIPSCAVIFFATIDGREGWSDRCPHDAAPLLSLQPAQAILPRSGEPIH